MARQPTKTLEQVENELSETPVDKRKEEKRFQIVQTSTGLYGIKFTAGGEVPDVLKTLFTSKNKAEALIQKHNELLEAA